MTIWAAVITAFGGSFIGSAVVALLSQRWIERRERRIKRDQLCLDLYLNVIELILENEHQLSLRIPDGGIPPADIQLKRYGISHRLKLLATEPVIKAYSNYSKLVFRETTAPIAQRLSNPDAVVESREALIDEMAKHLREGSGRNESSKIAAFFVAKQPV